MESSAFVRASQFSMFPPKRNSSNRDTLPFKPWKPTTSRSTTLQCHKMYVPGFGEASPEAKAAKHLHDFFTYIAVRIVSAQLQSYNQEAYADMMQFLERHPLNDGDKFCADLMRESSRHKSLALRILEVRSAYCKSDFEWDNLKRLSLKMVDDRNTRLMRDYVSETSSVKSESEK
ncbi:UNVERIFIED_CONTAM: Chaperonin-like RBCX protein 1, chloroplastic [Sesamum angustifolium]|uniref:Chaperonin-like RBCX protein 1, chloroplastic n=2 Tax=Sesamum TaxID=4181 RepID=A0AAE1WSM6_9LAMI|nr:Chaperonin-like RBCX protein 1, chloroplastic [Sesamum angolense]